MAAVLAGALLLVHVWPTWTSAPAELPFSSRPAETITMQEVIPTAQTQELRPPPPAPLPPVVVPNDVLIEEPITFDVGLEVMDPGDDERRQEGTSQEAVASRAPDTDARLLRAVQPQFPKSARQDGVRARILVEVQVNDIGRVTEATILSYRRLDNGDTSKTYGLRAEALQAARRTLFRPAQANGIPVSTQTTLTFTFGE